MRKNSLILAALMMVLLGGYGCKKKELDKTIVTIVNRLDVPVTLDLYASEEDYHKSSNIIDRLTIDANQNLSLPGDLFDDGKTYYMDWYSSDYYYNNWYNDDYPVIGERVRIAPVEANNTYYLEPEYKGNARNTYLEGDGLQTTWIAVGAYLYTSGSGYYNEWNTISDNERYRRVTIHKGFTADYSRRDNDGNIITQVIPFMVQQSEDPYLEFKTADGLAAGNMLGGKLPVSNMPDYRSASQDTVMALFPDNEYLFMMVRQ